MLKRLPFALLAAIGFLTLLKDILEFHGTILTILNAVQSATRPAWAFILQWLPIEIPGLLADYLTMGAISAGMMIRMRLYWWQLIQADQKKSMELRFLFFPFGSITRDTPFLFYLIDLPLRFINSVILWPFEFARRLYRLATVKLRNPLTQLSHDQWTKGNLIYGETFMLSLLIIVANQAMLSFAT